LQFPPGGLLPQPVPGPEVGQALAPAPPFAATVSPPSVPLKAVNTMEPPAPPPPPPSFKGTGPVAPLEVMVPVLETLPTRIITSPPPAAPLESAPLLLFRVPEPPPPPRTTCVTDAGNCAPPKPPMSRPLFQDLPPWPPVLPLPPPPPPEFWSLAAGLPSVPPPPAVPGAPRAVPPLTDVLWLG